MENKIKEENEIEKQIRLAILIVKKYREQMNAVANKIKRCFSYEDFCSSYFSSDKISKTLEISTLEMKWKIGSRYLVIRDKTDNSIKVTVKLLSDNDHFKFLEKEQKNDNSIKKDTGNY